MALPERDIMEKHLEQTTAFREVLASRGVLVACVGAKLRSFAPTQRGNTVFLLAGCLLKGKDKNDDFPSGCTVTNVCWRDVTKGL